MSLTTETPGTLPPGESGAAEVVTGEGSASAALALSFIAHGTPAPQGSKNGRPIYKGRGDDRVFTGKVAQVESSKQVKPWRQDVKHAAEAAVDRADAGTFPLAGPLRAVVVFTVKKPVAAPKRRRTWPATRPDVDKYARAVLDALRDGGVYGDDGQVVELETAKRYPLEGADALTYPGVLVRVYTISEEDSRG